MKNLVIIVAAVVAAQAARLPRVYNSNFRDAPPFFDSPPPSSSRSLFFNSRYESSFPRHLQSFNDDDSYFNGNSPPLNYREGRIFFDSPPPSSSYFPFRKPQSFYQDAPLNFREGYSYAQDYKGPPPPAPSEAPLKQTTATRNEEPSNSPELHTTKAYEEQKSQQPLTTEYREPLSFTGHSNHLGFRNHALGFASVAAVTSSDINPLAVAEITSTTRASGSSTISMHPPPPPPPSASLNGVQISQYQLATSPPSNSETPTSAATQSPKIAAAIISQSTSITGSTLSDLPSTTPASTAKATSSVTPRSNLESVRNSPGQTQQASMILNEPPKTTYNFMTITQDFPPVAHGQLPIDSSRQQLILPDIKQNLLVYDATKRNYPISYQINQLLQHQHNSDNTNITPVRFSIPSVSIQATSPQAAPMKVELQAMDLSRAPFTLTAVPNMNAVNVIRTMNTFANGQHQIDMLQLEKLNLAANSANRLPVYYTLNNNAQTNNVKAPTQNSATIPLGSFYLVPSNEQVKQAVQVNSGAQGLQLQLGGLPGIEYLTSASNPEAVRPSALGIRRVPLNLQEQLQQNEQIYANIGFGQNPW